LKLKRFGVAVAALALAFTAGCGGGESGGAAESADLTKANFATEVGKAQVEEKTAHLEAKISAANQKMTMSGDIDMSKDDVAFDLALTGGPLGGEAQFILVDRVIYLKMPGLSQTNKYIEIDATKGGDPAAQMFNQMLGQLDPSKTFKAFDATTKLQKKGTAEIDGVETTQYTVTVDTQKALKAQGMAGQVPQGQLPKTIDYDVWVDSDNLVRKLRMNVQGSAVEMTLSQWGEPVEIAAPPAGQTTDMSQMMGQMDPSQAGPRG
jgi:hypothetical protein